MYETSHCRSCAAEMTGVKVSTFAQDGEFVVFVEQETSDCNWVRCRGCGNVLCKDCYRDVPWYCCELDRLMSRARAEVPNGEDPFKRIMSRSGAALRRLDALISKLRKRNRKNKWRNKYERLQSRIPDRRAQ